MFLVQSEQQSGDKTRVEFANAEIDEGFTGFLSNTEGVRPSPGLAVVCVLCFCERCVFSVAVVSKVLRELPLRLVVVMLCASVLRVSVCRLVV
jgi:hypothetical protein